MPREENVLDYILRARNTEQVVAAFQQVIDSLNQTAEAAKTSDAELGKAGAEAATAAESVQASGLDSFLDRLGQGAGSIARLTASFALAELGVRGLSQAMHTVGRIFREGIIGGASEAEQVLKRFNFALELTGQFSAATSQRLQSFASTLSASIGQSDEQILSTMQLLLQLGGISVDQVERVTRTVFDIAAASTQSTEAVARLFSQLAQTGEARGLRTLGIDLEETVPKAERLEKVLAILEARTGGTGARAADTFAGATAKMREALSELGEEIGQHILPRLGIMSDLFAKSAQGWQLLLQRFDRTPQLDLSSSVQQLDAMAEAMQRAQSARDELVGARRIDLGQVLTGEAELRKAQGDVQESLVNTRRKIEELAATAKNLDFASAVITQAQQISRQLEETDFIPADIKQQLSNQLGGIVATARLTIDTGPAETAADRFAEEERQKKLEKVIAVDLKELERAKAIIAETEADAQRISGFVLQALERRGAEPLEVINLDRLLRVLPAMEAIRVGQLELAEGADKWLDGLTPDELVQEWKRFDELLQQVRTGLVTLPAPELQGLEDIEKRLRDAIGERGAEFAAQDVTVRIGALIDEQQFAEAGRLIRDLAELARKTHNIKIALQAQQLAEDLETATEVTEDTVSTMNEQFASITFRGLGQGFNGVIQSMVADATSGANRIDSIMRNMVATIVQELAKIAALTVFKLLLRLLDIPLPGFGTAAAEAVPQKLGVPGDGGAGPLKTAALELRQAANSFAQFQQFVFRDRVDTLRFNPGQLAEAFGRLQPFQTVPAADVAEIVAERERAVRIEATISALDSSDFERYMLDKGAAALANLVRTGRM